MSPEEIRETQDAFVAAAERAKMAGADGIELHGAHGYLLSQFASPLVNRRKDRYGGGLEGRAAFALEIIDRLRKGIVDERFLLGYRMGADEPTLEEGRELARMLEAAGVDILHVSRGMGGKDEPQSPRDYPFHWIVYAAAEIAKQVSIPVIAVYGIRTPAQARWLVENAVAFAAVGHGLLVDPDWALKARSGQEVITCLECRPGCHWSSDGNQSDCPRYDHDLYEVGLKAIRGTHGQPS